MKSIKSEIYKTDHKEITIIAENLIERAKHNSKDFKTLRDTIGQKPRQETKIINHAEDLDFIFKYSK